MTVTLDLHPEVEAVVAAQMPPAVKFNLYDLVKVKRGVECFTAVVIDYTFRWKDDTCQESEMVYIISTLTGETLEVSSEEIEQIGCLTPPFQVGQSVAIRADELQHPVLNGKIGTIQGFSWNPQTNQWGFAVGFSNEKTWFFIESDLKEV